MQPPQLPSFDRDAEHLRLLAIFHFVVGGMTIFFSSIFIIHVVMAVTMYRHPELMPPGPQGTNAPPREMWLMMAAVAGGFVAFGWVLGALTIVSGLLLAKRKARLFSLIVAGVLCLNFPFGTALGVCSILVLSRNSVRERYELPMPA